MHRTRRWIVITAAAVCVAAAGIGTSMALAVSGGDDGAGRPITGPALAEASEAALAATGGGSVVETEVGDEEGYYEVEVKLPDGRHVDVHLDRSFTVLDHRPDGDGARDDDGRS